MSPLSLGTMVVVCGLVWGSFAILLAYALTREARRRDPLDPVDPLDSD